ncbi:SMI1/KNR4 family protein [Streptomyces sp. NPDC050523]|uniref:SMI1/KNR4 family protein n=1 Tax=Streptomyces sp. NPDC050523 TaxID=3365622 RepID=UPI00379678D7
MEAVVTPPDARVQGVVGSPGWIAFGDNGGGDRLAVDLTPGPRGYAGQIIMLSHEESTGAALVADSLTDLMLRRPAAQADTPNDELSPVVASVNIVSLKSIEAAAHPGLEFLELGPQEWRVLLDAGAVPRSLSAAVIVVHGDQDSLPIVDIANDILALWNRSPIIQTVLEGDLGPVA